ncbi:hypothetical protein GBA65_14995 [Rubrobacter marinus]|uniref:Uncharacterized protein n=1 Tax=Rubrobacter marinus TaxID=2653852 RepID=A0A6G8PZG7_9ACTN|nr:hypothetical protein [Rubrobacter marinus]QIN79613.1 hypothetical protein GBA65_14995 [Rubrobacter marinus]
MLSNLITNAGHKVASWGYRIMFLAEPVGRFEAWLKARNLDVWELGNERERIDNLLSINRESEVFRNREVDRLAAMYWKATGRWPKGHPQTSHVGYVYPSVEIAREQGLPEGARGMRVHGNVRLGGADLAPPPKATLVPYNRYGERIDLSEVEGKESGGA